MCRDILRTNNKKTIKKDNDNYHYVMAFVQKEIMSKNKNWKENSVGNDIFFVCCYIFPFTFAFRERKI